MNALPIVAFYDFNTILSNIKISFQNFSQAIILFGHQSGTILLSCSHVYIAENPVIMRNSGIIDS